MTHFNCELMSHENIENCLFFKRHMKYFTANHRDDHDPCLLIATTIPKFIDLLSKQPDKFYALNFRHL